MKSRAKKLLAWLDLIAAAPLAVISFIAVMSLLFGEVMYFMYAHVLDIVFRVIASIIALTAGLRLGYHAILTLAMRAEHESFGQVKSGAWRFLAWLDILTGVIWSGLGFLLLFLSPLFINLIFEEADSSSVAFFLILLCALTLWLSYIGVRLCMNGFKARARHREKPVGHGDVAEIPATVVRNDQTPLNRKDT